MTSTASNDYIRAYMTERPVDPARAALLIIDMQYATGSRSVLDLVDAIAGQLDPPAMRIFDPGLEAV